MKNFVQRGDILTLVAAVAVAAGGGILVGSIFGVAQTAIAAGASGAMCVEGVFVLPKAAGAITQGQKLYWDNVAKNVTTTATNNTLIGAATLPALAGDATVTVRLNGTAS